MHLNGHPDTCSDPINKVVQPRTALDPVLGRPTPLDRADPRGAACNGRGGGAPHSPGTKIVFLGRDGNILAESRLGPAASPPPYWRQRPKTVDGLVASRPTLAASSRSSGEQEDEEEPVNQLISSSRLDLWRSLNGSPTYPLPPLQLCADKRNTFTAATAMGGCSNGRLANMGGISAVAARRTAGFSSSRQSTGDSQMTDEEPIYGGLAAGAAVNGDQQRSGRPQLVRQLRVTSS